MIMLRWATFLLALTPTCLAWAGQLEGRVLWQDKPLAAALVEAFTKAQRDPNTPPIGEGITGEDGSFRMDLDPGRYWLWARATVPGAGRELRLAGEAAANPVVVTEERVSGVEIRLQDAAGFAGSEPAGAGARGTVTGAPPTEVLLYAYTGNRKRPMGPGFVATASPAEDGSFQLNLRPGHYTLAARWRTSGQAFGALLPGDRIGEVHVTVAGDGYTDAGSIELRVLDPKVRETLSIESPPTGTVVSGRLTDRNGAPAGGLRVLAFTDPRMAGKPLAISGSSSTEGRFQLNLPGGGSYFLGARSRVGGPIEPGEKVGANRGADGTGLAVAEGETREDVTIVVEEVW